MTEREKYQKLLEAAQRLVAAARQVDRLAGPEILEIMCVTAIQSELKTAEAA